MKLERRVALGLLLLSSSLSVSPAAVRAATSSENGRQAQILAVQALENLRRGEDAADEGQKMALYQQGLSLANRAVALDERNADAHFAVFGNKGRILLLKGVGANPVSLLQVN